MNPGRQKNPNQTIHPQSHFSALNSKFGKRTEFVPTLFTSCVSVLGWFCCSCDPNSALLYSEDINLVLLQGHICDIENEARRSLSSFSALKVGQAWTKLALQVHSPQQETPQGHQGAWIAPSSLQEWTHLTMHKKIPVISIFQDGEKGVLILKIGSKKWVTSKLK